MKHGFSWCAHCGEPHPLSETVCPITGGALNMTFHRPAAASPHAMIGKVIDHKYRIRGILGQGGMGTVFEAEHLFLQRSVALKLIRSTTTDPKRAMKRMQHEARIAGAIGHPHICDVYDIGEMPDGSPYLVMQRLVGETLANAIVRQGPFPALLAIQMMIEVLSGVAGAHGKNIVHRDLKPQNIFLALRVGCDPLAKVLDFGLSKMTQAADVTDPAEQTNLTSIGARIGTPYYMAPEQLAGTAVDARADLFACGVIFYETLTGHKPFSGRSHEELTEQIAAASLRPATALREDLPLATDEIIARALAYDRDARYSRATSFQDDLHALRSTIASGVAQREAPANPSVLPSLVDSRESKSSGSSSDGSTSVIFGADTSNSDDEQTNTTAMPAIPVMPVNPSPRLRVRKKRS